MEDRQAYDTDLTDAEWNRLEPLVPAPKPGGRPPKHTPREIVNGICYAIRSGGAWKLLPHDLPPWRTVYHYFWSWRRQGVWQQIHDTVNWSASLKRVVTVPGRNFPQGFLNETQVIAMVLSADPEQDPNSLAIVGAGAALAISDLPFHHVLAGVRVGMLNGKYIANPNYSEGRRGGRGARASTRRNGQVVAELRGAS